MPTLSAVLCGWLAFNGALGVLLVIGCVVRLLRPDRPAPPRIYSEAEILAELGVHP